MSDIWLLSFSKFRQQGVSCVSAALHLLNPDMIPPLSKETQSAVSLTLPDSAAPRVDILTSRVPSKS